MNEGSNLADIFEEELIDIGGISEECYEASSRNIEISVDSILNIDCDDLFTKNQHSNDQRKGNDFSILLPGTSTGCEGLRASEHEHVLQYGDKAGTTLTVEHSGCKSEPPDESPNTTSYNVYNGDFEEHMFDSPDCVRKIGNLSHKNSSHTSTPFSTCSKKKKCSEMNDRIQQTSENSTSPFLEKVLDILCSPILNDKHSRRKPEGENDLQSKTSETKTKKRLFSTIAVENSVTERCVKPKFENNVSITEENNEQLNKCIAENSQPNLTECSMDISVTTLEAICQANEVGLGVNTGCKNVEKIDLEQNEIIGTDNINKTKNNLNRNLIYSSKPENVLKNKMCKVNVNDILEQAQIIESANNYKPKEIVQSDNISSKSEGFLSLNDFNSKYNFIKTDLRKQFKQSTTIQTNKLICEDSRNILFTENNNESNSIKNQIIQHTLISSDITNINKLKEGATQSLLEDVNYITNTEMLQVAETIDVCMFDKSFNSDPEQLENKSMVDSSDNLHTLPNKQNNTIESFGVEDNNLQVTRNQTNLKEINECKLNELKTYNRKRRCISDSFENYRLLKKPKLPTVKLYAGDISRDKSNIKIKSKSSDKSLATNINKDSVLTNIDTENFEDHVITSLKSFNRKQIARTKIVKISEGALKNYQETFNDSLDNKFISAFECNNDKIIKSNQPSGLQTANGKISEETLAKERKERFNDFQDDKLFSELQSNNDKIIDSKRPLEFQTANGKNIKISEEALLKANETINGCENDKIVHSIKPLGFQTASGKNIKMSEEALAKAKETFNDSLDDNLFSELEINNCEIIQSKKSLGFQTTNVKNVTISEKALLKEKETINDYENDTIIYSKKPAGVHQTACGNKAKISEEALAKAKEIFNDCHDDKLFPEHKSINHAQINSKKPVAFQTANGKTVIISEEAIAKAKEIFNDSQDDSLLSEMKTNNDEIIQIKKPLGFQSASGENVKISEEAIAKAKEIFNDCQDDNISPEMKINNDEIIQIKKPLGFQTASGKNVKISEEALAKAKEIFNDCQDDKLFSEQESINHAQINSGKPVVFQTASGKTVNISEEALAKAKEIFNDSQDDNLLSEMETNNDEIIHSKKPLAFHTASGKNVTISEESLLKAKETLNDCEDDKLFSELKFNNDELINSKKPLGFQTASGKNVIISEKALAKVKETINDCHDDNLFSELETNNDEIIQIKKPVVFQTASGENVKISEEALTKAKEIFYDSQDDNLLSEMETHNDEIIQIKKPLGFQTASGENVKISEEAIAKAKEIFNDCQDDNISPEMETNNDEIIQIKKPLGFQTASGKNVKISEEALAKAKEIFNDCQDDKLFPEHKSINHAQINSKKPVAFHTANGKTVIISEEAIAKAKEIFNDSQDDSLLSEMKTNNDEIIQIKKPLGFQTASGENVKISEEAIAKAKEIFNDCQDDNISPEMKTNNDEIIQIKKPLGFQTANGKNVKISEEALAKAKEIFNDCQDDKLFSEQESINHTQINSGKPVVFQTASGKTVNISEDALAKAKEIFNDSQDDNLLSEMETNNDEIIHSKKPLAFHTASGKNVTISEESLLKAKETLNDCEDDKLFSELKFNNDELINSKKPLGFLTASGKNVIISEKALAKVKETFNDCHDDNLFSELETNKNEKIQIKKPLGFQTASGKNVKISEEALTKAKEIFYDSQDDNLLSEMETHNDEIIQIKKPLGFQTANGKNIEISEEALAKAKEIFNDCQDDKLFSEQESINHAQINSGKPVVFQTASGENVKISEEALAKAKEIFYDSQDDNLLSEMETHNDEIIQIKKPLGFQKASGENVKISEEAIAKAKEIFNDCQDDKLFSEQESINHAKINSKKPIAFQTASGRKVKISEEALAKAKEIFYDSQDDNLLSEIEINNDEIIKSKKPLAFHTASGKNVTISEESLLKAKETLNDCEDKKIFSEHKPINHAIINSKKPVAFQTGRGNKVKILEEALAKAKEIFNDSQDDNLLSEMETNNDEIIHSKKPLAFHTASGKNVTISEESLLKAKETLNDCEDDKLFSELKFNNDELINSKKPLGFQTASGKNVIISEKALAKVKETFNDCHDDNLFSKLETNNDEIIQIKKPLGFQTASGKNVIISEKALAKVKETFNDCEDDKLFSEHESIIHAQINSKKPVAFKTASGKNVIISEEAIAKAKEIFNDSQDDNLLSEMETNNDEIIQNKKPLGFHTASGKNVTISEESLLKAKETLNDCEDDKLFSELKFNNDELINSKKPLGFQTASGKNVIISEKALAKVKETFNDCHDDNLFSKLETNNDGIIQSKKPLAFHTASGKNVTISEESLLKAKETLNDFEYNFFSSENESINHAKINSKKPVAFKTASGKNVIISEEAIAKAKEIFNDSQDDNLLSEMETNNDEIIQSMKPLGFHTASGKNVKISEESLLKVKETFNGSFDDDNLFSEIKFVNDNSKNLNHNVCRECIIPEIDVLNVETSHTGCRTPGGKKVQIKEIALEKAKEPVNSNCYEDNLLSYHKENNEIALNNNFVKRNINSFLGFNTCDGILVSKDFLVKTKEIFKVKSSDNFDNCSFQLTTDFIEEESISKDTKNDENFIQIVSETKNLEIENIFKTQYFNLDVSKTGSQVSNEMREENITESSSKNKVVSNKNEKSIHNLINDKVQNESTLLKLNENYPFINDERISNHVECERNKNVFSNSDLDMLCHLSLEKPLSFEHSFKNKDVHDSSQWDNNSIDSISLSVVHEISESTAALLADEEFLTTTEQPSWLKICTSSPSLITDKHNPLTPLRCFDNEMTNDVDTSLSPVLGSNDRFHKKRKLRSKKLSSIFDKQNCVKNQESSAKTPVSKFKPPYITSTPLSNTNKKTINRQFTDSLNHSVPFPKKLKRNDKSSKKSPSDVIEGRKKAAEEQEKNILNSKNIKLKKQCKGSYLLRKLNEKSMPLRDLSKKGRPTKFSCEQLFQLGIKKSVIEMSSRNALDFVFSAKDYYSDETCSQNIVGIPVGDGGLLILNDEGCAGLKEITRCFLSSPGVDPSLVSPTWVHNHYRWIVHKLAATEKSFPTKFSNRLLTPNNVMLQLKYRYDREIDRCQRPALRKVLERDDSAGRTMILFVSNILYVTDKDLEVKVELELSDGWYSIVATVDQEMVSLVKAKIVVVGTKLVIHGAELLNCEQGCDPLEMRGEVRLKVYTNSIRRAKWDARLGFYRNQKPLSCRVTTVLRNGGNIGYMCALVVRVYPMLYLEKQSEGKSVMLNWKAEQKASETYKHKRSARAETLCSQLYKELEVETQPRQKFTRSYLHKDISSLTSAYELYTLMEHAPDPGAVQDLMSAEQLQAVAEYCREEKDRKLQELQSRVEAQLEEEIPARVVVPMLKIRLLEPNTQKQNSCIMTIWRPSPETTGLFTEGSTLAFYNITAAGYRNGELQLTAGRQTQYELLDKDYSELHRREVTSLDSTSLATSSVFNEIDVVGIVTQVTTSTVYLTDTQFNLFRMEFWPGVQELGWDDLLVPCAVVAASNIQVRHGVVSWNIPCGYTKDCSTFTLHPRQPHLVNAITMLQKEIQLKGLQNIVKQSGEKLKSLMEHRNSGGVIPTPYKMCQAGLDSTVKGGAVNHHKSEGILSTPNKSRAKWDSCIKRTPTGPSEKPSHVEKKIKILQSYGEPPPLSPILLSSCSKTIRKPYRFPVQRPVTPESQPLSLEMDSDS